VYGNSDNTKGPEGEKRWGGGRQQCLSGVYVEIEGGRGKNFFTYPKTTEGGRVSGGGRGGLSEQVVK